jgi:hypothetical protein
MNTRLSSRLTLDKIHSPLKELLKGRALGPIGFLVNFFLVLCESLGLDLVHVCLKALNVGTLNKELNTRILCIIP